MVGTKAAPPPRAIWGPGDLPVFLGLGVPRIEHFVVLFQENRTHDSVLSDHPNALGDLTIPVVTDPLAPGYIPDPEHGNWWSGTEQLLNDYHGRLTREQISLLYWMAEAGATLDTMHSEFLGPSDWNHLATAQANTDVVTPSGKRQAWIDNPPSSKTLQALGRFFREDPDVTPPLPLDIVTQSLEEHGFPWGVFGDATFHLNNALLPSGYTMDTSPNIRSRDEFNEAARRGELPAVSWVAEDFAHTGHTPERVLDGVIRVGQRIAALQASPKWKNTLVAVIYDDWGGFYDHMGHIDLERLPQDPDRIMRLGSRVAAFMLGPHVIPGAVSSEYGLLLSQRSVLKTINELFGLPSLDPERDAQVSSLMPLLQFDHVHQVRYRTTLRPDEMPKDSFMLRMSILARRTLAKVERNMLIQEIGYSVRLARKYGRDHPVTLRRKKLLGIAQPKVGRWSLQGVPSTRIGWAVFLPLALGGWVPGIVLDALMKFSVKHGITGIAAGAGKTSNTGQFASRKAVAKQRVVSAGGKVTDAASHVLLPYPFQHQAKAELIHQRVLADNAAAGLTPSDPGVPTDIWGTHPMRRSPVVTHQKAIAERIERGLPVRTVA
jgi:hypothetical protein